MEKLYFGTVHLLGEKNEMQYSQCFSPKIYDHSVALNQSVIFLGGGGDRAFFCSSFELLICHLIVLYKTFLRGNKR